MNILVTGGSSGLGKSIVEKLSKIDDNHIFFTYNRHAEDAMGLATDKSRIRALKCDFTCPEEVDSLFYEIPSYNLDVIINNAYVGLPQGKHFHKTEPEEFLNSFQDNLIPVIRLTQAAIQEFRKKKFGKIINILTSSLLNLPPVGYSVYSANKAYLEQLSKSWNSEYSRYNITSNCISPDFMQTNLSREIDDRIVEQMKISHPLHTLLLPDVVAETVVYLVNASQQVNGVNIPVNAAQDVVK